jgi:hypothetical protein
MRAFVIDDEFFNQSAIEATPRSSRRTALEKLLDTADIVRDGRKTGISYSCRPRRLESYGDNPSWV